MNKLFTIALAVNLCTSLYAQPEIMDKHTVSSVSASMEEQMAGEWKEEVTLFKKDGAVAGRFSINCTNTMVLGGKFMEGLHTSTMGNGKLEGHSVVGVDPVTRKIEVVTWNNLSNGMVILTGNWRQSADTVELRGTATNQPDHKPLKVRQLITFISKDEYIIDNYDQYWFQPEIRSARYRCVRVKK